MYSFKNAVAEFVMETEPLGQKQDSHQNCKPYLTYLTSLLLLILFWNNLERYQQANILT